MEIENKTLPLSAVSMSGFIYKLIKEDLLAELI